VTVTSENAENVISDEFLEFFFERQKAFYAFYFQYMPMGREPNLDDMPSVEQRILFWRRIWEIIEERQLFLIDFWNHGPLVNGCISAGRSGGYIYIDWNGDIMPCVFFPFSVGNINQVFEANGSLNSIWEAPFFETIRQWQDYYGFAQKEPSARANWLRPCPVRDHYPLFKDWVEHHKPRAVEYAASQVMQDGQHSLRLRKYCEDFKTVSQIIWESEYLNGNSRYDESTPEG
jgi:hypothetical protein